MLSAGAQNASCQHITKIPGKDLQIVYNLCNLPWSITAGDGTTVNYSNIYHETQHAIQYELGRIRIFKDQYMNMTRETILQNEVEAYKVEFIIGNKFNPSLGINSINNITIELMKEFGY